MKRSIVAIAAMLSLPAPAWATPFAQPAIACDPKHYVSYRTDMPIRIDGKLDETIWAKAAWTDNFVDIEGAAKPTPRFKTRAKMLWDDDYLYLAIEMEEPDLWATLTERDAVIFQDNDIEVFIDPDGSTHKYMELEVNALATAWDLLLIKPYRDGKNVAVNGWDMHGLKVATSLRGTLNAPGDRDGGWTAEIAIPWSALRESYRDASRPKAGEQWRLNFSRVQWQTQAVDGKYRKRVDAKTGQPLAEDNWVWSPQGLVDMHYPEMWGVVQFSAKTAGTGNDDYVPDPKAAPKWALRQLYYAERSYWLEHARFGADLATLGLALEPVPGYAWPPNIEAGKDQFKATLTSLDGKTSVAIEQDGYVH
ncbi:MAG: carbohydrate-binding family 9-like protein [Pseudomonadota bacterium]|nr:carbohydrate-binding family 9-like protein [Pseudomonadota bacterium]